MARETPTSSPPSRAGLDRLNRICDILLEGKVIEIVADTITAGNGAKRTVEMVRKRIMGT
jgi:hypothetical protein